MPIQIDESSSPVIRVTLVGELSDAEVDAYLVALGEHVHDRRRMTVTIFDLARAGLPSAAQRARQAAWLTENRDALSRTSLGTVFVVGSPVIYAALCDILWVQSRWAPRMVVRTLVEAEAWAALKLAEAAHPRS